MSVLVIPYLQIVSRSCQGHGRVNELRSRLKVCSEKARGCKVAQKGNGSTALAQQDSVDSDSQTGVHRDLERAWQPQSPASTKPGAKQAQTLLRRGGTQRLAQKQEELTWYEHSCSSCCAAAAFCSLSFSSWAAAMAPVDLEWA